MPAMKFHLLPIGTRFRHDGRLFTKNAPLAAIDEQGNQRMIPRSAAVEIVEATAAPATDTPLTDLVAAAEEYHRQCLELFGQVVDGQDPAIASQLRSALASAHDDFLKRIEGALGKG